MHQMVLLEVCDFNKRVNVTIAVTQPQKMDLGRDQVTHLYLGGNRGALGGVSTDTISE